MNNKMKLLEIEAFEYTTPIVEPDSKYWQPITVKVKYTDKNNGIIGRQFEKQLMVYEGKDSFDSKFVIGSDEWLLEGGLIYKFVIDTDEWLLEGCWLQGVNYFTYGKDSYTELKVRFDSATKNE